MQRFAFVVAPKPVSIQQSRLVPRGTRTQEVDYSTKCSFFFLSSTTASSPTSFTFSLRRRPFFFHFCTSRNILSGSLLLPFSFADLKFYVLTLFNKCSSLLLSLHCLTWARMWWWNKASFNETKDLHIFLTGQKRVWLYNIIKLLSRTKDKFLLLLSNELAKIWVFLPCGQTSVSIRGVLLFLGLGLAFPSFLVYSTSFSSMISEDDSETEASSAFWYPVTNHQTSLQHYSICMVRQPRGKAQHLVFLRNNLLIMPLLTKKNSIPTTAQGLVYEMNLSVITLRKVESGRITNCHGQRVWAWNSRHVRWGVKPCLAVIGSEQLTSSRTDL